jgi:hypothetical protein
MRLHAWCPICGEIADPSGFRTPEQQRQIREHALRVVTRKFDEAVRRAHKPTIGAGGLVAMSWTYQPGARRAVVPASADPWAVVRTGRTKDFEARELAHASDPVLGKFEFNPEYYTDNYAEQRGLEQLLYERHPEAQFQHGAST